MKRALFILLTLVLALCGAGCGSSPSDDEGSDSGSLKVGIAYSRGGRGDLSFNDSVGAGVDRAKSELGVTVKELSPNAAGSDLEEVLRLLASSGHDPVFAVGFFYAEPLTEVAAEFPDTSFVIVDDTSVDAPNVTNLAFREEQASFLVGAAAALRTETDHLGFVGGVQTPPQEKFLAGYAAGAREINPDIKIDSAFLTQPPDFSGFSSPDKAREAARAMYEGGADIVYHAAGASGLGVFQAAQDTDGLAIGVDVDQRRTVEPDLADVILTSATKELDVAVFNTISEAQDGSLGAGVREFGLAEGGVDYATSGGGLDDIEDQLEELREQIIAGEITVPTTP